MCLLLLTKIWNQSLVITVTNLVILVIIAGLSGEFVFVAVLFNFLGTYLVLQKTTKSEEPEDWKKQRRLYLSC